jgi:hypothetical protein
MFSLRLPLRAPRTCPFFRPSRAVSARPTLASLPTLVAPAQFQIMSGISSATELRITPIEKEDYDEWERLFRLYIEFYKSSLPDAQYPKTFARILDSHKDLYGLVLRDSQSPRKLYGLAHFFPMQTPWAEEMMMHFNGERCVLQLLLHPSQDDTDGV